MAAWTRGVSARRPAFVALGLVAFAATCIGYLHVVSGVSPVSGMVSDYVFTPAGVVLLPVGVLALAVALVVLVRALGAAGLAVPRVGVPLAVAIVGLVGVALCRADPTGAPSTLVGLAHKASGGLLFGGLPVAGWMLARGLADRPHWARLVRPTRVLAAGAAAVFVFFLATYLPVFGVSVPGGGWLMSVQGLAERCVLVPEVALVVLVALRLATHRPVSGEVAR